jgi:hypothetical protein
MAGPLTGLRILDLSRVLAGPWAGQVLGDLGADVIKVERPGLGDETRGWGPPYLKDAEGRDTSEAAYYLSANRNKRSITLDISRPEGQAIARRLAERSDVVIENFKVGGLAAYGLDYESLKAVNPGLVYCSITGFGQTGPYAPRAGYDFSRCDRHRPTHRPFTPRRAGDKPRQPEHELSGDRQGAGATRQRASQYRALSGLPHRRRQHDRGGGQRPPVRLAGSRARS